MPPKLQTLILAIRPTTDPTAPLSAATTTVSPATGQPMASNPV
jgi:hypothetical protein